VIQFTVETDGNWGVYGYCNPPGGMYGPWPALTPFDCRYSYTLPSHGNHCFHPPCPPPPSGTPPSAPLAPPVCPANPAACPGVPTGKSVCLCKRMNETVGREKSHQTYGKSHVGGNWYSHPMAGQVLLAAGAAA